MILGCGVWGGIMQILGTILFLNIFVLLNELNHFCISCINIPILNYAPHCVMLRLLSLRRICIGDASGATRTLSKLFAKWLIICFIKFARGTQRRYAYMMVCCDLRTPSHRNILNLVRELIYT